MIFITGRIIQLGGAKSQLLHSRKVVFALQEVRYHKGTAVEVKGSKIFFELLQLRTVSISTADGWLSPTICHP